MTTEQNKSNCKGSSQNRFQLRLYKIHKFFLIVKTHDFVCISNQIGDTLIFHVHTIAMVDVEQNGSRPARRIAVRAKINSESK